MRRLLMVCLAVLLCNVLLARASGPASISGKVLDASGGVVSGVEIVVTNAASGSAMRTKSGTDGTFIITGLPSGTYTLQAVKPGFLTFSQKNIQLQAGQTLTTDISLRLPSLAQSIEVRAKAPGVAGATPQPTQQQLFNAGQTIRVLDRKQMDAAGPLAGAAQIVSYTPGANVIG